MLPVAGWRTVTLVTVPSRLVVSVVAVLQLVKASAVSASSVFMSVLFEYVYDADKSKPARDDSVLLAWFQIDSSRHDEGDNAAPCGLLLELC